MKLASKLSHKLSRKLAIKPFGYSSSLSNSELVVPASLKQLLFHDNNVAQPAYYTPQELEGSGLPHNAFLKDYSLGLGDLRPKQPGYCYNFDGTNYYVRIPYNANLNTANFSARFRFNLNGGTGFRSPLFNRDFTATGRGYGFYVNSSNVLQFWVYENTGVQKTLVGPTIQTSEWYDIIGVVESTNAYLYVNGDIVDTEVVNYVPQTARELRIGAGTNEQTPSVFYPGKLSDVQIYNYALTAQQVADLYAGTLPATKPIAHYPLQEQSGPRAYDISGNGNHGTIMNATTSGVGSIHVADTGVKKSYSNDEGYTDGLVLSYGDILDSTFAATDAYFEIEWEGEIPPNDGISRAVLSKNADSNFSENQRQFGVRWVGNKLGGLYFTDLSGTKVRGYETDAGVTSGSTFKVIYDGSLDADSRMSFYVDDVLVPASVTVTAGTITSTDDIKNSTAPLAIGSSANVAQTQYIPSSVGFYHTSVTIRDASSTIFSASRATNWKDTVGNITPTVIHNRKIPNVSATESSIGTIPQFTGRVPQYGLAKGPAWQGDGSTVSVALGTPIIPATGDFEVSFPLLVGSLNTTQRYFFAQTIDSSNRVIASYNTNVSTATAGAFTLRVASGGTAYYASVSSGLVADTWYDVSIRRVGNTFSITFSRQGQTLTGSVTFAGSVAQGNANLLTLNPGSGSFDKLMGPVTATTGGITTTYSPIEGTRNVAVTKSDGTYSIINNAVVNGTLANLYTTGNGSWKLPAIENGAHWDGTGLIPAAPGAEVAANGNAINIPAYKHPRSVLVDRTGAVITPLDTAMGTDGLTNETWEQGVEPAGKRYLANYSDRHGAGLVDVSALDYFEPRAFVARVGTSTSPTSVGTKAVTGVGFKPKVILPFGAHVTGDGGTTTGVINFGAASQSAQATIGCISIPGLTTSDTDRRHANDSVFSQLNTSALVLNQAAFSSFGSDGFTLNWNPVFTDNRILNHIALGGTDLEVSLTQHQMNGTNAPQSFAHGLTGGAPTALLVFGIGATNPPETVNDVNLQIGAWSGNNQWNASCLSRNGLTTTVTRRALATDRINGTWSIGNTFSRAIAVSSVDAMNVNATYVNTTDTVQRQFWLLAIRGAKAQVGTFDCNGSLDPLTIATPGIAPKLFLPVLVRNGVSGINTVQNFVFLTIGASDGINNVSCGITDANAVTTTNARRYQSSNSIIQYDQNGGKYFEATASFLGESVIVNPTLIVTSQWGQGGYLILGE